MKNTVLVFLETTSKRFPDKTAIIDENGSVTFSELRSRALRLAASIRKKTNDVKSPIMVYLPKSCNSIIAFMGILYSGNFYTPTDVTFPFAKVRGIIDQLHPILYISIGDCIDKLVENGIQRDQIIDISQTEDVELPLEKSYYDHQIDSDLAYVLFTSGSTGIPKGVSITHRGIIDYAEWLSDTFDIDETFVFGNQAPFYFDNSILDIYSMLSQGSTMVIIPQKCFAWPVMLMRYIAEKQINTIFWVPSALISVANADILSGVDCSCLKRVLFCGEVMPNKQLNHWRKHLPDALYVNMYGPTEITDVCSYFILNRDFKDDDPLPIGKACRNTEIIILNDRDERVVDPHEIGELCVRGSSLAVGYWNNSEKTSGAFVQNPLNPYYPEKIYRTGDLVFYNDFGEIEFIGRKDYQIKHMGYRIELGEIETAVFGYSGVQNCCAVYDDNRKRIVMFCQGDIDESELQKYLIQILPKYMIPSDIHILDGFPYNDNGKIDRKKLKQDYL